MIRVLRYTTKARHMESFSLSGAHLSVFQSNVHRDDVGVRRVDQDSVDL